MTVELNKSVGEAQSTNLDILRAFAVSAVVVDHTLRFFGVERFGVITMEALGRVGVLLFFVHTCYVLMLSLKRQHATGVERRQTIAFFLRRAFRIYPLSVLVVSLIVLFGLPGASIEAGEVSAFAPTPLQALANLALVQNLAATPNILGPLWSLPIEVQMYLALPALYAVALMKRGPTWLGGSWLASALVAAIWPRMPAHDRFNILAFVPCFLPGVIAFSLQARLRTKLPAWTFAVGVSTLGMAYIAVPRAATGWFMCLGVGLLIAVSRDLPRRTLARLAATVAKYSYGIYLSHVLCIWVSFELLAALPAPLTWLLFAALLTALPWVLFHAIESPCIRLGGRIARAITERPTENSDLLRAA